MIQVKHFHSKKNSNSSKIDKVKLKKKIKSPLPLLSFKSHTLEIAPVKSGESSRISWAWTYTNGPLVLLNKDGIVRTHSVATCFVQFIHPKLTGRSFPELSFIKNKPSSSAPGDGCSISAIWSPGRTFGASPMFPIAHMLTDAFAIWLCFRHHSMSRCPM